MSKKHILIVSQYFYPEQFRINDIALDLVSRGYEVTVITGYPNYPDGEFWGDYSTWMITKEVIQNINVIRLPIIARGNTKFKLVLNYISFVISGGLWNLLNKSKVDLVYIYEVSPMTQALPGVWYGKRNQVPVILYVMDLWPENVQIVAGINNKHVIKLLNKMVDYIYNNTTLILTSSNSFIERIIKRGISKSKLRYWPQFAEEFYHPVNSQKLPESLLPQDGKLNLTFAGNIGEAQGLDVLVDVAKKFQDKNIQSIRFNIIGDGRYKESLLELIKEYKVESYFNIIGRKPADKIKNYMAFSDAALITLSDNPIFEMTIPAKLQSYLACGIPIIGSISGETNEIINYNKIGMSTQAGNSEELYNIIQTFASLDEIEKKEYQTNAYNYYKENFMKTSLMNKLDNWIKESQSSVNLQR